MTKYVLQYRARVPGRHGADWKDAVPYDSVDEAMTVQRDCVKEERKGTKDWRVRVVADDDLTKPETRAR